MSNILVLRTEFSDWAQAMDRAAARSGGRIVVRDPADADTTIAYMKRHNLTALAPTTYPQMKAIAASYGKFVRQGIKVVGCADHQLVETFDDKARFVRFMSDHGLEDLLPEVYVVGSRDGVEELAPIAYPCIAKLGVTFGGVGATVHLDPRSPVNLAKFKPGESFLVQRFIPGGTEFGGHFYLESGDIKRCVYYEGRRDPNIHIQRGRMPQNAYTRHDTIPEHDTFADLFARIDYTGFACVDFKVENGAPRIFEINPRLGGTLIHDAEDLPRFLLAPLDDA
jgi:carbamoylphosphate synthase large subunit